MCADQDVLDQAAVGISNDTSEPTRGASNFGFESLKFAGVQGVCPHAGQIANTAEPPTRNGRSRSEFVHVKKVLAVALHPRSFRTIINASGRSWARKPDRAMSDESWGLTSVSAGVKSVLP